MHRPITERRVNQRYDLRLPLHYRVAQRGLPTITGSGLTLDLSVNGISFRCRKPLPVGAHIEMSVDWPARYGETFILSNCRPPALWCETTTAERPYV